MFSRVLVASGAFQRRVVRPLCWVMAGMMCVALAELASSPASAAPAGQERPEVVDPTRKVPERPALAVKDRKPNEAFEAAVQDSVPVSWPAPGSAEIPVTTGPAGRAALAAGVKAGGLTVSVAPAATPAAGERAAAGDVSTPGRVRVEVLDRAVSQRARVDGPVFRLGRTDGQRSAAKVGLTVGYEGIANLYGGDFGARLRLARLPECALSTPDRAECAAESVPTRNNGEDRTLTAEATTPTGGSGLYAMVAEDSSSQGSYAATQLSPSAKWSVSASSGGFTWSYPLRMPPVPGEGGPNVGLSYSSQAVDGRTATTNNQGSWIGEGFSYEPGHIERRYKSCKDDGHDRSADQCWAFDNATMLLNGSSTELVRVGDTWRPASDDGSKIEKLTGATNGDNDGEYWRITTVDGIEYYFGLNRLPGWSANKEETLSTWTVPVYGDDTVNGVDEPCKKSTFAESYCDQAWRWNLDYVKDRNGQVVSYFYGRESNYYARGGRTDVNGDEYHRGGWLKRIDYGQRDGAVYSTNAPARVRFDIAERCLSAPANCDPEDLTDATAARWHDVPWDRNCAKDTKCKLDQVSPTFWTRKRLTAVTTEIRGASGWTPVDRWKLEHLFTDNGDGSRTLWLYKLTHTGLVNGSIDMPYIEFAGLQKPNRIDKTGDQVAPLVRFRLATVYTDTGGQIDITYADEDCNEGNLPTPGNSTRRCYPVKWDPTGTENDITDWFHKYVVAEVIGTDRTGGAPDMVTRYKYHGDAAWRHSEPDGLTKAKDLTWSEWRGYGRVEVTSGSGQTMTTRNEYYYLRGMHGDKKPTGGTREVTVTDSTGTSHVDYDEFSGFEYESKSFDGSTEVTKTLSTPWRHNTATESHSGMTKRAHFVNTTATRSLTAFGSNQWRETRSSTVFDETYGRVIRTENEGDVSKTGDEDCTRSTYVDNPTAHLYSLIARTETVSVLCSATPDRRTQVLNDVRTWYDGKAYGVPPTTGNPTRSERLASHDGTTPTYVRIAEGTFDSYGRPLIATNALGEVTRTTYTETHGLTTKVVQVNPLEHETVTDYHPAWGTQISVQDPNDYKTLSEYDPLGRLAKVWLPNTSTVPGLAPNFKYTYLIETDKAVAVKSEERRVDATYRVSYQLYDGFLRARQSQTEGPGTLRLVADTFYTPTGQVDKTYDPYPAVGTPRAEILPVNNGDVDGQTLFVYDGADRVRHEIFAVAGVEKWRTTTTYGGDWVSVDPPEGGTPRTTVTNALGKVVEIRQYKGSGPSGDADKTEYTYTSAGHLATMKDPAGNIWSHSYDQRGRKIETIDPDAGTSTYRYDDLDRLVSSTNGAGKTISHTFDEIGRKTATYHGAAETGELLSQWRYDDPTLGQLSSTTRFADDAEYTTYYTDYDEFYRPHQTWYEVPAAAGAELAGLYGFGTEYNWDGTVQSVGMTDGGGLPFEVVVNEYDSIRRLIGTEGVVPYLTAVDYTSTGEVLQSQIALGSGLVWSTYEYEQGSKRLNRHRLDRSSAPVVDIDARYGYDPAGNVTSIADTPSGIRDIQCFNYDYLRQLVRAWATASTATDPCAGGPATSGVGGVAPYHHSYTYDVAGNRKTETQHAAGGSSLVERDYEYPEPGQPQPHTLTRVTERTSAGDRLHTYEYDDAGNTTRRTAVGEDQELVWNPEGRVESVTEAGRTTSFVYDVDGGRILRKEPDATTLYLPGMELRLDHATRAVDGTRYYPVPGGGAIVRKVDGLSYLAADQHGTGQAVVDDDGSIIHRRSTPFGGPRGVQPPAGSWPTEKGFVGGTQDSSTGLTHLGAREYDPTIGRFISVDPVQDLTDPQQWNGYTYANNDPVTRSDPTGLLPDDVYAGRIGSLEAASYSNSPYKKHYRNGAKIAAERDRKRRQRINEQKRRLREATWRQDRAETKAPVPFDGLRIPPGAPPGLEEAYREAKGTYYRMYGGDHCNFECSWDATSVLMIACGAMDCGDYEWQIIKLHGIANAEEFGTGSGRGIGGRSGGRRKGGKSGGSCESNSFTGGSRVRMADGTSKPIDEVKVGDQVIATDPETGETAVKTVVATIVGQGVKNLVEISVDVNGAADGATDAVVATAGHPFWLPELKAWLPATELQIGQLVQTAAGTWVQVTAIKRWTEKVRVYNLTVEDIHTYYALAGETSILVHNCGISLFRSPHLGEKADAASGLSAEAHGAHGRHTGTAYLGESAQVAEQYAGQGYEPGYYEYVMKPEFEREFPASRYRRPHANSRGAKEYEWVIPQEDIPRFNSMIDEVKWWNYYEGYSWQD
ncbi:polymorphic toxin-type HINT domain-containing protein [Plantactinospora sp. WMMC1484]|uniref:polymorphic toxin-type HINT domain-containing protein n=1 Tax=Plantactinospora sp. WMMC1484 TaxID=3404122 RepID=UPI003BF486BC